VSELNSMFSSLVAAGGTTVDADDDGADVTDETDDGWLTVVAARTADVDVDTDGTVITTAEDDGTAARPAERCRLTPDGGLL